MLRSVRSARRGYSAETCHGIGCGLVCWKVVSPRGMRPPEGAYWITVHGVYCSCIDAARPLLTSPQTEIRAGLTTWVRCFKKNCCAPEANEILGITGCYGVHCMAFFTSPHTARSPDVRSLSMHPFYPTLEEPVYVPRRISVLQTRSTSAASTLCATT